MSLCVMYSNDLPERMFWGVVLFVRVLVERPFASSPPLPWCVSGSVVNEEESAVTMLHCGDGRLVKLRTGEVLFEHDNVVHAISGRTSDPLAYVQARCGVTTGVRDARAGLTTLAETVEVARVPGRCPVCFGGES